MKEAHDNSRVTPEGRMLGEQMAKMFNIAQRRLKVGELEDKRCKTCAFRPGTVPNGCAQTQLDTSKCLVEGISFYCHQDRAQLCYGWYLTWIGLADILPSLPIKCDYPLSPPDSQRHIVDAAEAKRARRAEKRRAIAERLAARGAA